MSLIDLKLEFAYNQKLDGVTSAGVNSDNTLDLGKDDNNLSGNRYGAGYLNVVFVGAAASPASNKVAIKLQHSKIGVGPFTDVAEYAMDKPDTERSLTVLLPKGLHRFVRVKFVPTATITKATVSAYIGAPRAEH